MLDHLASAQSIVPRIRNASRVAVGMVAFVATSLGMWHLAELAAPNCHEGNPFEMLALRFLTWVVLTAIAYLTFLPASIYLRVLIPVANFFFVFCLSVLQAEILIARLYSSPPPRPLFHNQFVGDERVLLPYWRRDPPLSDNRGNLMFADDADNMLAIVIKGSRNGCSSTRAVSNDELQVEVVDEATTRWVSVRRDQNSLVAVRPNGDVAKFSLAPGAAEVFHREHRSRRLADLLFEVEPLMENDDYRMLNSFVSEIKDR